MVYDPERALHLEWIGLVQPVGLVVSPVALRKAQAFPKRHVSAEQDALRELMDEEGVVEDIDSLLQRVLGWQQGDLQDASADPAFEVALPEYGETLRPTWVVRDSASGSAPLLLAVRLLPGVDLDAMTPGERWHASPQARLERLLRDTSVPIGLLTNGRCIRLVYAPRGESSGHATFVFRDLSEVAGRPLLGALIMLLGSERLFSLPDAQRLSALLSDSRKHQNEVSTLLAEQVLEALHELLRGFQAASDATGGALLGQALAKDPQHVYGGLLSVLMRLVFLLYAEERGLMPQTETWSASYSVTGLFERLREDEGNYPDTMDQRYGAWSGLLALFRLVYDGGGQSPTRLQARQGRLFDPDAYPFLEGRPYGSKRAEGPAAVPPRISDGVIARVLARLMVLSGERLSYRALDVEQIGSVYEAMMGFQLEIASGRSVAVRKKHVIVDLDALLAKKGPDREKALAEAECKLPAKAAKQLKEASTTMALLAALGSRLSPTTPSVVPRGSMVLDPTEERRQSGSHYTPRSLTEPIVREALRPVLSALGPGATPEQILEVKVCDPAMGSGAFLVEACRQLADALVDAWSRHASTPAIPADEDLLLHARRIVAQRCLYGVDKNPFAVDLAKLSLWLVTLAKDHPFTFLDHALKHGDTLVGLTKAQIAAFHWDAAKVARFLDKGPLLEYIAAQVGVAADRRAELVALPDEATAEQKRDKLKGADKAIEEARSRGDLLIAAFLSSDKPKGREDARNERFKCDPAVMAAEIAALRSHERPIFPFHWEIEFPEVFGRPRPGFDTIVGNPPFAGKNTVAASSRPGFGDWLKAIHEGAHGNSDLVAHFFRRAYGLLREGGTFGLIATNTIAQGDTRATGLRPIRQDGGTIYSATRRVKWPGRAAVVVSVIHVRKGPPQGPCRLDGREVPVITAFLFHAGGDDDPAQLPENEDRSFIGSYVLGMGFTFDDTNPDATPIAEMHRLIEKDARNAERIFPYIGGEEVNDSPTHAHRRYVINFADLTEAEARTWPDLMAIVEEKVKPARLKQNREIRARYWWRFGETTPALYAAVAGLERVLVCSLVSKYLGFTLIPSTMVYSHKLCVVSFPSFAPFCLLQSRIHEVWAIFFSSTLEDRLNYSPSDCFETFPFPPDWASSPALETAGQNYYDFRADLLVRNDQGLTETYNRFHDPDERDADILQLRALHAAMDRAVLDAYGWTDLTPTPEFLLDWEDDEEEGEEGKKPRRKKPWRLRWPDDVREEVLARLLALNRQRSAK